MLLFFKSVLVMFYHQSQLVMQFKWKKLMTIWKNYRNVSTLINRIESFADIWKLLRSCYDCMVNISSAIVFFVNGQSRETLPLHQRNWPLRQSLEPGRENFHHTPQVEPSNILLSHLHTKFGLMKILLTIMGKIKSAFKYVNNKSARIS